MAAAAGAGSFPYIELGSKEFEDIAKHITNSWPKACIMFIQKILHPPMKEGYDALKEKMIAKGIEPNETTLLHGTNEISAYTIAMEGYNPRMNKVSAFGLGTYFSPLASVSWSYMPVAKHTNGFELSYMLVNKVLVGRKVLGASSKPIDYAKGDTQVNSLDKTTIYSVPRAEQSIPIYIIGFHKNAQ